MLFVLFCGPFSARSLRVMTQSVRTKAHYVNTYIAAIKFVRFVLICNISRAATSFIFAQRLSVQRKSLRHYISFGVAFRQTLHATSLLVYTFITLVLKIQSFVKHSFVSIFAFRIKLYCFFFVSYCVLVYSNC